MNKKGLSLNQMAAFGFAFVLIGVVLGMGAYINSQIQTTAGWATTSLEYAAVQNSTRGLVQLSGWLPIIAVVAAAGIVLAILVAAFSGRRGV